MRPASVWVLLQDVASWPMWMADLVDVHLRDDPAPGVLGRARLRGLPRGRMRVVTLVDRESITVDFRLPFCRLTIERRLRRRHPRQVEIVERLEFRGPLAGPFHSFYLPRLEASFVHDMARLVSLAAVREGLAPFAGGGQEARPSGPAAAGR